MRVRRLFLGFLVILSLAVVGVMAIPNSTPAQDNLEGRVADLEATVAAQDELISDLDDRVAALEASTSGDETETSNTDEPSTRDSAGGAIQVSGVGSTVSDSVHLDAGAYRISATLEVSNGFAGFIVVAYQNGEPIDYPFNELIDTNGTWTGSQVLQIPATGDVFFEVSNTDAPWTLTLDPL